MSNHKIIFTCLILSLMAVSCKEENLPLAVTVTSSDYTGEWKGVSVITRSLTSGNIIETPAALSEVMSLRQENGKDTFNFRDPVTGMNITGRLGTWHITQINYSEDAALNGARILRLRVITSLTRITYSTYTIRDLNGKQLVLYDGANKTLTYNK